MFAGADDNLNRPRSPLSTASNLTRGYGRFLQPDPLGYADGLNWYNYVAGDPINNTDPTGTDLQCNDGRYFSASELRQYGDTAPCQGEVTVGGGGGSFGFGGFGFGGGVGGTLFGDGGGGGGGGGGGIAAHPALSPTPVAVASAAQLSGCNDRLLSAANNLLSVGSAFDNAGDVALLGAGGIAVGGIVAGETGIGLPFGLTAFGIAGDLASVGVLSKGFGSLLQVGAHGLAAKATGDPRYVGPGVFAAIAGAAPFKLGPVSSYFQDKVSSAASEMVGFKKIPTSCPK